MNRWVSSLCGILLGCAICLPPGLLLLLIYGLCLTNPAQSDYHTTKLRMMFRFPDPGIVTWMGVVGVFFGVWVIICRGVQPFLGRPPVRLSNAWRQDIRSAQEVFGHASARQQNDQRIIPPQSESMSESHVKQGEGSTGIVFDGRED